MTTSILVPYTSGCEARARAWAYVRHQYEHEHPGWEFVVGQCAGEWSKGAALDDAARRSSGDVLVVADADSFVAPDALVRSAELVSRGAAWVVPHRRVHRLSQGFTVGVLAGVAPRYGRWARQPYIGVLGGGLVVLSRDAWDTVGGIDPRFHGWGGEDISFGWALETLCGRPERLDADLWHLWHPHPAPRKRGSPASEALAGRYREARGHPDAMRVLVEEAKQHRELAAAASAASVDPEPQGDRAR